jgi:hypothetical protein
MSCGEPTVGRSAGEGPWPTGGTTSGGFFGVPLVNFLGWTFTVYLFIKAFGLYLCSRARCLMTGRPAPPPATCRQYCSTRRHALVLNQVRHRRAHHHHRRCRRDTSRRVRRLPALGESTLWHLQASIPKELRDRSVRMVAEVRPDYPSQWAAISAVAGELGIGASETVRTGSGGPRSTPVAAPV